MYLNGGATDLTISSKKLHFVSVCIKIGDDHLIIDQQSWGLINTMYLNGGDYFELKVYQIVCFLYKWGMITTMYFNGQLHLGFDYF